VDVGLRDEAGQKLFNPPSLRGVSQRQQFFHDGRAATLEEVFSDFGHQVDESLTEDELRDLVRFLRSL
jgi:cytochrome c peroxidase